MSRDVADHNFAVACWAVLGVVAFVLLVAFFVHGEQENRAECEAKGGAWYHPYKSDGLCLAPGTVIR